MKIVVRLTAAALLLVAERTFVTPSPISDESRRLGVFTSAGISNKDQDVKDLERLKPSGGSFSLLKTHSKIYSNVNGKEKELAQTKEEVEKDGSLLAKVEQTVDKNGDNSEPHIITSLDIPSQNFHKIMRTRPNIQKTEVESRNAVGLQYSPADMADYIFWTGDERGVTSAIEEYLQDGMMSRSDALDFLQEIKKNLELMQNQFLEKGEIMKERLDDKTLFAKKSSQEAYGNVGSSINYPGANMVTSMIPDEDYEDLIEKLKMSDYLFNEYSLEEVIYQLAKVMFTQSLSRGSVEAQDALTKVTGFLDYEAQQGKITRNMEKKILTVLISALSDTLTEHPELVNTARESLGIPQPEPLVHRLFPQGQLKSEGPVDSVKGHRLQGIPGQNMKRTIQDSGLKDDEIKH